MPKSDHIPAPAVQRLSLYLRQLESFQASRKNTVSSRQLGRPLGLSAAQVRKDLAYFGQFGHPGVGYRVPELIERVRRILGTDKTSYVAIVGIGNLGRALISFRGFRNKRFEVVAAFDNDEALIGTEVPGTQSIRIQQMQELPETVREKAIRLGILAVPASAAQSVADDMIAAGLRAILNFAPVALQVCAGVALTTVDLAVHLEQLSFQMNGEA